MRLNGHEDVKKSYPVANGLSILIQLATTVPINFWDIPDTQGHVAIWHLIKYF